MIRKTFLPPLMLALGLALPGAGCVQQSAGYNAGAGPQYRLDNIGAAPLAFVRFCMSYRSECSPGGDRNSVVTLTPSLMAQVERVNAGVNSRIQPITKTGQGPINVWRLNPASGDCNDYAVTKRHELMKLGVPGSALLLAVALTSTGEGHLLLVLRSDHGDLVLDNLTQSIRPRSQTSYSWIKRQSPVDPRIWENV